MLGAALLQVAIFGPLLFVPAWTLNWWRAWVFLGVVFVASIVSMVTVFPGNEGLLAERMKPPIQRGQPLADKIILLAFIVTFLAAIVLIPLDVFRLHLTHAPGPPVSFAGLLLCIAGWWITSLALKENAFAAPVVKDQRERGQRVVDTGVYRVVRHPMYAGGALLLVGIPLWLQSYAAALLMSVAVALVAVRIPVEERFLHRILPGYGAYAERVRYRLIPFLW